MIRKCLLIFLGISSLAFGSKDENREQKTIVLLESMCNHLAEINSQLHHQTRLLIQLDMIVEQILEIKKPYDYDWYKEE